MNQDTKRKVILIRHAESAYNAIAANVNKHMEGKDEEEKRQEIAKVKFREDVIDCSISEKGEEQTKKAAELVKDVNIGLVISSPLRRCLQTTHRIFANHPNKPKVQVAPLLKEVMSSSCDLGNNINDVKKEFPDFDFALLDEFETPEFWYIDILESEEGKKKMYEEIFAAFPNKQDAIANAASLLARRMKETFPGEVETSIDMNTRVQKAKEWLRKKAHELPQDQTLAVVAHSRFLRSFVSKEYGQLGEFIGTRYFVNCEVFEYEL